MEIRLITVKEDLEKAFNILNQEYPLSFYEYALKHETFSNYEAENKLLGIFDNDRCLGTISYIISSCPHLGRILEIKEIYHTEIKSYKAMMNFIDQLAQDEDCLAIKISKNKAEGLSKNVFDRMENFLRSLIQ